MSDLRKGDLVRATRKSDPEDTRQFRYSNSDRGWVISKYGAYFNRDIFDFEVLDRPLPPIPKELLFGAIDAYRKADGTKAPTEDRHLEPEYYGDPMTAVINYLREHDTYNKENSK